MSGSSTKVLSRVFEGKRVSLSHHPIAPLLSQLHSPPRIPPPPANLPSKQPVLPLLSIINTPAHRRPRLA